MFKLINFVFLQIFTHFEFDACNTFQKSWDRGNKRLEKLRNSSLWVKVWALSIHPMPLEGLVKCFSPQNISGV